MRVPIGEATILQADLDSFYASARTAMRGPPRLRVLSRRHHRTDDRVCAMYRYEYDTEVNKGSINMRSLSSNLNKRGSEGWRLAHAFQEGGNTVLIYERPVG